ncbi:MAG: glycosyltransferase family 2 protein [Bacteroidaceae bacterium]|nr:glycosyltransferase family 2 protein [Bacteroidaceae bacterium]
MGKVRYSFVLPAYKARFLREAVESIMAQTYRNLELVIVDDASPEGLYDMIKDVCDERVRYYVNERNIGGTDLVAQWNHSLEYAEGDYVVLASDDDIYHPQYLEKMNALVEKYPQVDVFRPRVQYINELGVVTGVVGLMKEYTSQLELVSLIETLGNGIPFYLFNRRALKSIGGFVNYPLAWHSDDATVLKMAKEGIAFCADILFSFRLSGESISTKRNDYKSLKQKIEATEAYYQNLPALLEEAVPQSEQDLHYRQQAKDHIPDWRRAALSRWLFSSSKGAIIRCLPKFLRPGVFSFKELVSMYARHLLLS